MYLILLVALKQSSEINAQGVSRLQTYSVLISFLSKSIQLAEGRCVLDLS